MIASHQAENAPNINSRQLNLEEVDLLVRKCHRLHDEEIAKAVTELLRRVIKLFGHHRLAAHQNPAH